MRLKTFQGVSRVQWASNECRIFLESFGRIQRDLSLSEQFQGVSVVSKRLRGFLNVSVRCNRSFQKSQED